MSGVPSYEAKRMERIAQNRKVLEGLEFENQRDVLFAKGLDGSKVRKPKSSKPRRKRVAEKSLPETLRRSARVRRMNSPSFKVEKERKDEEVEVLVSFDPPPVVKRPSMDELRAQMLERFDTVDRTKFSTNNSARDKAVERWGPKVLDAGNVDWKKYVRSRDSVTPPHPIESPFKLMQERFHDDVWGLLISCCLMSRVSSGPVKETAITAFFDLCPTPSRALEVTPEQVKRVIAPLGLFDNRYRSILELSKKFLLMPEFQLDLEENKVYGFGAFSFDSYLIFSRGLGSKIEPHDKNLRLYCDWAKKELV